MMKKIKYACLLCLLGVNMSKTISARIDDAIHHMITEEANQTGMTVNEKLKGMISDHFNEENNEIYSRKLAKTLTEQVNLIEERFEQKIQKQSKELKELGKVLMKIINQKEDKKRKPLTCEEFDGKVN